MMTRSFLADPQQVPSGDSIWELHWEFILDESVPESVVRLATPIDTKYSHVFEQNISVQGMRLRRSKLGKNGREIVARVTRTKDVAIAVDFAVHISPVGIPHFVKKQDILKTDRRQQYISPKENLPVDNELIIEVVESLVKEIQEPKLIFDLLFEYSNKYIKSDKRSSIHNVLDIISQDKASVLGKSRLLTTLARAAKIPARQVMGIVLKKDGVVSPYYWMEINIDGEWLSYDPTEGFQEEVPYNYIAVRKNGESFLELPGTTLLDHSSLEISQRDITINFIGSSEKGISDILDLNRLSLSTRLTLALLLLLPLGALITVFIRQILGPNVFGTFTPTFIALAFSQVGWKSGGIILFLVTLIGIIGRSFTPKLGLNRVSRLTMVFTLVAITMIFSVSMMVHYGIAPDGSIVLLPIVILTFMIDQIYKLADSDGWHIAGIRLVWTIIVSAIVLTVLQMELLGLWFLKYPEAHLLTAALVISIGQYKGKKLFRKIGLDNFLEPEKPKKSNSEEKTSVQ